MHAQNILSAAQVERHHRKFKLDLFNNYCLYVTLLSVDVEAVIEY